MDENMSKMLIGDGLSLS